MSTTLDCTVLRDLFGTDEMRGVFDSRALVRGWLDAERALADAEAAVGVIPAWAAERIAAEADAQRFDLDALRAGLAASQHPLVPLVRALSERAGDAGAYVHWGATTQDVMDTGLVLQIRRGLAILRRDVARGAAAAAGLARRHRADAMPGRTHGQHAVPISFGAKAAGWADELWRAHERLEQAGRRALCVQLSGAAGTLAALGEDAARVRREYAGRLDLGEPAVSWHAARDRLRDVGHAVAEIGHAGERIAAEVIRLQATEVAEVAEPATPGHVGSSTMPQKRNPMTCEYLVASAKLLVGAVAVLDRAAAHAGERDMGAWATEWIAVPQAFILAASVSDKLAAVLEGLEVDAARMRRNLDLSDGAIMAEAVMMSLAATVGHEPAHEIVAGAARRARDGAGGLRAALLEDRRVLDALGADAIDRLLDPARYLGLGPAVADAATPHPPDHTESP